MSGSYDPGLTADMMNDLPAAFSVFNVPRTDHMITPPPIIDEDIGWSEEVLYSQDDIIMVNAEDVKDDPDFVPLSSEAASVSFRNEDSSEMMLSIDQSNSMRLQMHLTSHESRTSLEHVNDIIKNGTQALIRPNAKSAVIIEQRSPSFVSGRKQSKHIVKKMIVLQPGDDPEKITADAISEITQQLNMEAAKRIAQGRPPENETVIEITRIKAPGESFMNFQAHPSIVSSQPMHCSQQSRGMFQNDRKHHRRKSPHPKRYMYHSPSPPQRTPGTAHNASSSAECYFEPKRQHSASSQRLLGRGASIIAGSEQNNKSQRPAILRPVRQQLTESFSAAQIEPMSDLIKQELSESDNEIRTSGKLDDSLTNIQWLGAMSGDAGNLSKPKQPQGDFKILVSERQIDLISKECGRKKRPPYSYMHLIQMAICSDPNKRKTLKEIYKWIEDKFPYYKYSPSQGWKNSIRHNLSLYDIFVREKSGRGQGKTGSSYWTLRSDVPLKPKKIISSARSTPSPHVSNEPEHPYSPQPQQQPSHSQQPLYIIRENPSSILQSVHTKKKGPVPLLPKPTVMQTYALIPIQGGVPCIPQQPIMVSPVGSTHSSSPATGGSRKPGLKNIAMKPDPHQRPSSAMDYVARSISESDMVHQTRRPGSACELQQEAISLDMLAKEQSHPEGMVTPPPMTDSYSKSSMKRNSSPTDSNSQQRKQVKIVSKVDVLDEKTKRMHKRLIRSKSATCTVTSSTQSSSISASLSMDSTELGNQLAQIRFADSGIVSDCSNLESSLNGLPKPRMYSNLQCRDETSSDSSPPTKKETLLSLDYSSDLGLQDILSSIEKSLSTPMRHLLCTPPKSEKNCFTSTPFKITFGSPAWSPIKGLTPIAGDPSLEVNLFTPIKADTMTSTPCRTDTPEKNILHNATPYGNKNPTGHFQDLSPLKTPFKSPCSRTSRQDRSPLEGINNQSFVKFLGDFHLDSMLDEGINLDVSNMSFSALQ